jgi:nitroreductase
MDLYEGLITRRSIRKYTSEQIGRDLLEEIVKAGMYAPSAVNCQPWHYIIIDDRSLFEKIMDVHPYAKMLNGAQAAILVCGDEKLQHGEGYWSVDCGAATQNILLAAHAKGLGAVWLGLHPRGERKKQVKELFQLPDHIQPFSLISLGWPAEEKEIPERYKPDRIHYNNWQEK